VSPTANLPLDDPAPAPARRVLVVDDSKAQRHVLSMSLRRWRYEVTEAASGLEALELCRTRHFDIVLSDWVMPGLSGLEFCCAFRALPGEGYSCFILLTSKSDKTEVADGLDAGADDFLTKPINPDELRARMRAGERILGMQQELVEKNRLVRSTLDCLQAVYDSLDRDLIEARKVQQALVRDRHQDFGRGAVSLLLRPSGHVGGDLVGWFSVTSRKIALYAVDVSGHGVASAMMTARLAGMLSASSPDQNVALARGESGQADAWPPEMVAFRFNRMMVEQLEDLILNPLDRNGRRRDVTAAMATAYTEAADRYLLKNVEGVLMNHARNKLFNVENSWAKTLCLQFQPGASAAQAEDAKYLRQVLWEELGNGTEFFNNRDMVGIIRGESPTPKTEEATNGR